MAGREFFFTKPATCLVGRAPDCDISLFAEEYGFVSRNHCVFEINPPHVRVRDLNSLNGTFINGRLLGKRTLDQEGTHCSRPVTWPLEDGDEVRVGNIVFQVEIRELKENEVSVAGLASAEHF
jgi:pSer/pThr/pTyr-binding forkhead associated (FHA) protein